MNSLHYCISLIIIFSIGTGQLKNLQVLDFESERELKKYMKTIGKDLGVKCTFCHDINDKSIDTDHKLVAREMIKMQMDLNKSFLPKSEIPSYTVKLLFRFPAGPVTGDQMSPN